MKRLQNHFVYGDYRETQDLHGSLQSNKARDCTGTKKGFELNLQAPDSGRVERVYKDSKNPRQNGFHFVTPDGKDILFHHANPVRTGQYSPGEHMGGSAWHHFHVAFKYQGKWHDIREILPITEPIEVPRKMQSIAYKFKTRVTVEDGLIIRSKPDDTSDKLAKAPYGAELEPFEIELDADLVAGVSTWIKHTFEGVTGFSWSGGVIMPKAITFDEEKKKYEDKIKELESSITSLSQEITRLTELVEPLQGQIATLQAENVTLTTKVDNQTKELTKFYDFKRSVFYALFLIFNRKP